MPDLAADISLSDLIHLAVALAIGFLIGFEREHAHRIEARERSFAGARTFSLTALSGALAGLLDGSLLLPSVLLASIAVLTAVAYWAMAREKPGAGGTTEIALFVTFLLGLAATRELVVEAAIGGVATAIILSMKARVQRVASALSEGELHAALRLLAISVIILPILPDQDFGPYGALNPRTIWLMVVFISGLSFLGYWLIKFLGEGRGVLLTGLAGGLASSTATTLSLSRFAKEGAEGRAVAAGIIAANVMMLIRVGVLTAAISRAVLATLWPALLAGAAVGAAAALYLWRGRNASREAETPLEIGNPMEIRPALVFAALLAVISLAAGFSADEFGNAGLVVVALISGLADVDALTLTAGRQAASGAVGVDPAALAVMAAVASNIVVKGGMAWAIGGARAGTPVAMALAAIIAAGGVVLFVF
ncbi:MgtC/SapB family protein [Hyphococcus luteus]|uniref:Uncharacterized protein n=1 Tax=Hyphococcus luteus TaxID=2058213 RepID=A0A2S7K7Y8_9PROT|nr:MgtC/SapB family protein [Marinicaulis flavus]PQA88579.1 hypothetical protein CW354_09865 [Marinicaulis flavus]